MGYAARVIRYRTCLKCRQDIFANATDFELHLRACKAGLILPQIIRKAVTIHKVVDDEEDDWSESP